MFRINEVVRYENKLYRILASLTDEIVWIPLDSDSAFPFLVSKNELVASIDTEMLTRVQDPFEHVVYLSPEKGTVAQRKRDHNHELILPLITEPFFYIPKVRSAIVNRIIENSGSTKQTLYRLTRRYWQRGQTPNALIPDYKNSGGKGNKRIATGKKLGRPRKYQPGIGSIVDEDIERMFRTVIDRYLLTDKKHTFAYALRKFQSLYQTHYPDVSESEIPTRWQMMHFYKREYGKVEEIRGRSTKIAYAKDIRPLISTANTQVLGPGSRYEIDATIADIYLVSDSERANIVGRPIIYMVIDVFSRMVAGFYVGFENPSYVAAMQALVMAMTDKVAFCKKYGVPIKEQEWPVIGLPDAILADRGELLGYQIESLERNFSVRIENTPPYRGDAKGIVEREFRTLQADFKPFVPGVVAGNKIKKHGERDYRLEACLTVTDFTAIILASVLIHNQSHILEKYDRDIDIPSDLPMTPLSLWNWGIQNRTGQLRVVSEDALKVSLLPRVRATVSTLGVCVFGVYYTSSEIVKQGWMHRSKDVSRPQTLYAAYDPRNADHVFLFPKKNSAEFWVCELAQRSRGFAGCSFWDVWLVSDEQKKAKAKSRNMSQPKRRELDEFIESKLRSAKKMQHGETDLSNRERIAGIRTNRKKAKEAERQKTAYSPKKPKREQSGVVIPLASQQEDLSYPGFVDELFDEDD